jgi:hypothetical protein
LVVRQESLHPFICGTCPSSVSSNPRLAGLDGVHAFVVFQKGCYYQINDNNKIFFFTELCVGSPDVRQESLHPFICGTCPSSVSSTPRLAGLDGVHAFVVFQKGCHYQIHDKHRISFFTKLCVGSPEHPHNMQVCTLSCLVLVFIK